MAGDPLNRLETALQRAGINNPTRHDLAVRLYEQDARVEDVHRLEVAVREKGGDGPGLLVLWIRSGDWRSIVEAKMGDEEASARRAERIGKGTSSSIRFVAEDNPYGWADPERMRGADHSQPGKWNAYRQAYNGAMRKRPDGTYDCRMFGSARFEVIGATREPKPEWDAEEVEQAQRFGEDTEPLPGGRLHKITDAMGPVYGE